VVTEIGKPSKKAESNLPKRLNINMSETDWKRLEYLRATTEVDSFTELVKDSFRLLEFFVKSAESGKTFYTKKEGEELTKFEAFKYTS